MSLRIQHRIIIPLAILIGTVLAINTFKERTKITYSPTVLISLDPTTNTAITKSNYKTTTPDLFPHDLDLTHEYEWPNIEMGNAWRSR